MLNRNELGTCDICDNEAQTSCPYCEDVYCFPCFHNIGEGEYCSEAPDAQPRGIV